MKENRIWHPEKSVHGSFRIGTGCVIHAPTWIGSDVSIGNNCKIQAFAFIPDGVTIEDDVFIGPHVCFTNDKHPPSNGMGWSETIVRKGAVIGAGAIILPGVEIGENAVVGAGSLVAKNVRAGETVISMRSATRLVHRVPRHHEDP